MDRFDAMMERFGIWDCAEWSDIAGHWFRHRVYFDGAWIEGHQVDPLDYFGA